MCEKDVDNPESVDNLENVNPNSSAAQTLEPEGQIETESKASEMEELRLKLEAITDQMLRIAAEFENYKKRVQREQQELIKYANENIIKELIPIVDNFERAISSAKSNLSFDSLHKGVDLIYKQMIDMLKQKGVVQVEAVGESFDPNLHEAITQVASSDHPENTVIEEFQKGYMLNDRVIRPAMVSVSKREEPIKSAESTETEELDSDEQGNRD